MIQEPLSHPDLVIPDDQKYSHQPPLHQKNQLELPGPSGTPTQSVIPSPPELEALSVILTESVTPCLSRRQQKSQGNLLCRRPHLPQRSHLSEKPPHWEALKWQTPCSQPYHCLPKLGEPSLLSKSKTPGLTLKACKEKLVTRPQQSKTLTNGQGPSRSVKSSPGKLDIRSASLPWRRKGPITRKQSKNWHNARSHYTRPNKNSQRERQRPKRTLLRSLLRCC